LTVFAFPCAWTAWEWLSSLVSPNGSYGAFGYDLVAAPWAIQSASVFGLWSVSFLICAVASALALVARDGRKAAAPTLVVAALFALNAGFGIWRLSQPAGASVPVALVADND